MNTLLAHGVDPNLKDKKGRTALVLAVAAGQTHAVGALLKSGAHSDVEYQGFSILKLAMARGKANIVELLKQHPA